MGKSTFFLAREVALLSQLDGPLPLLLSLNGLLILSYGMTANILENPLLAFLVGLVMARSTVPRPPAASAR